MEQEFENEGNDESQVNIKTEIIELDSDDAESTTDLPGLILEYPGKKESNYKGSIQIFMEDIECLAPTRFLNDKIMDFWLNYVYFKKLSSVQRKSMHLFSSLFFNSIEKHFKSDSTKTKEVARRNKTLTSLFQKDFIFIPISLESHWVLAVVCYPRLVQSVVNSPSESSVKVKGRGTKREEEEESTEEEYPCYKKRKESSDEEYHPDSSFVAAARRKRKLVKKEKIVKATRKEENAPAPIMLIFDSFKLYDVDKIAIAERLRAFLTAEWKMQNGSELLFDWKNLPMCVPKVPQQENSHDCGLFVLEYFENFFLRPVSKFTLPLPSMTRWFHKSHTDNKREEIYQTISSILSKNGSSKLSLLPCSSAELENNNEIEDKRNSSLDLFADAEPYEDFEGNQISSPATSSLGERGDEDADAELFEEEFEERDQVPSPATSSLVGERGDEDADDMEFDDEADKMECDDAELSDDSDSTEVIPPPIKKTSRNYNKRKFVSESDDEKSVDSEFSDEYVDLILSSKEAEASEEEEKEVREEEAEASEDQEEVREEAEASEGEESVREEVPSNETNDDETREVVLLPNFVSSPPRNRFQNLHRTLGARGFKRYRNTQEETEEETMDKILLYSSPKSN